MNLQKQTTPKQILQSLNKKYQYTYYFFTSKYINHLIYEFEYQKAYNEDIEYLRRAYRSVGLGGKKQIEERIKLVSKYYETNDMIGPQMPMIAFTQMKDIFTKRFKRLRRLKHVQEGSQISKSQSSFGSGSLSFSIQQDFLKQIHLQFSQLMDSSSSQIDNPLRMSDDFHDIYGDSGQFIEQINFQSINFKEPMIDHLVCDFQQIDVQSVINFYKDIKKSKRGSMIMSQIMEEQQKLSKKNSSKKSSQYQHNNKLQIPLQKHRKSSTIQKQSVLSSYAQIFAKKPKSKQEGQQLVKKSRHWNNLLTDQYVNQYKHKWQNNVENAQEEIEKRKQDLKENRQRVRQKAEKLLMKIKRESLTSDVR